MPDESRQQTIRRLFDEGRALEDQLEAIRETALADPAIPIGAAVEEARRRAFDLGADLRIFEREVKRAEAGCAADEALS